MFEYVYIKIWSFLSLVNIFTFLMTHSALILGAFPIVCSMKMLARFVTNNIDTSLLVGCMSSITRMNLRLSLSSPMFPRFISKIIKLQRRSWVGCWLQSWKHLENLKQSSKLGLGVNPQEPELSSCCACCFCGKHVNMQDQTAV